MFKELKVVSVVLILYDLSYEVPHDHLVVNHEQITDRYTNDGILSYIHNTSLLFLILR